MRPITNQPRSAGPGWKGGVMEGSCEEGARWRRGGAEAAPPYGNGVRISSPRRALPPRGPARAVASGSSGPLRSQRRAKTKKAASSANEEGAEHQHAAADGGGRDGRGGMVGTQQPIHHPGLAADLAHDPAAFHRDIGQRDRQHPGQQQAAPGQQRVDAAACLAQGDPSTAPARGTGSRCPPWRGRCSTAAGSWVAGRPPGCPSGP